MRSEREAVRHLSARWLDEGFAHRRKALEALEAEYGFPPAMSRGILNRLFGNFRRLDPRIGDLPHVPPGGHLGYIFPANVPDPAVEDVLGVLWNGRACTVRFSDRAAAFGRVFIASVHEVSARFARAVRVAASREDFFRAARCFDAVVAYGTGESLDAIRRRLPDAVRLRRYGDRFSVAAVFDAGDRRGLIARAVRDVWLYDQRGCLSPRVFFVRRDAHGFARGLQEALERLNRRHPVRRPRVWELGRRVFLDRLSLGLASGAVRASGDIHAPAFVYEWKEGPLPIPPGGQITAVSTFRRAGDIARFLGADGHRVQCVGVSGTAADKRELERAFGSAGPRRFCAVGRMQAPPVGWNIPDASSAVGRRPRRFAKEKSPAPGDRQSKGRSHRVWPGEYAPTAAG